MTLVNALETLKAKGITHLSGLHEQSNIEKYISNARACDEDAQRYSEQGWAQYHMTHADGHYIIETSGHHIIATHYDNFDMATYSDYDTDDKMHAAFNAWTLEKDAEAIAAEMDAKRPGELPHAAWIAIAIAELQAANRAAHAAFERDFGIAR